MARYVLPDFTGRRYDLPPDLGYYEPDPYDPYLTGDADMGVGLDPVDPAAALAFENEQRYGATLPSVLEPGALTRDYSGAVPGMGRTPAGGESLGDPMTAAKIIGLPFAGDPLAGAGTFITSAVGEPGAGLVSGALRGADFEVEAQAAGVTPDDNLWDAAGKTGRRMYDTQSIPFVTGAMAALPQVALPASIGKGAPGVRGLGPNELDMAGDAIRKAATEANEALPDSLKLVGGSRAAQAGQVPVNPLSEMGQGAEDAAWEAKRQALLRAAAADKASVAETFSGNDARRFLEELDAAPGDDLAARAALQSRLNAPEPTNGWTPSQRAAYISGLEEDIAKLKAGESVPGASLERLEAELVAVQTPTPPRVPDVGPVDEPPIPPVEPPAGGVTPPVAPSVPDVPGIEYGFAETMRTSPQTNPIVRDWLTEQPQTYWPRRDTAAGFQAAQDAVNAEGNIYTTVERLSGVPRWQDTEVFQAQEVLRRLAADGDMDAVKQFAHVVNEHGLELGRGVQAYSVWNRLSPEGVLLYLDRKLTEAATKGKPRLREALGATLKTEAEETATAAAKRGRQAKEAAGDALERAARVEGATGKETAKSVKQRSFVENAINYLQSEGRNPKGPQFNDPLKAALAKLRGYANESGWLMPHDEADAFLAAVDAAKALPKAQRTEALQKIAQDVLDTYLPAVESRALDYRKAKANVTALDNMVNFMQNLGRNPKAPMGDNERAVIGRIKALAQQVGATEAFDLPVLANDMSVTDAVARIKKLPVDQQYAATRDLLGQLQAPGGFVDTLEDMRKVQLAEARSLRQQARDYEALTLTAQTEERAAREAARVALTKAKQIVKDTGNALPPDEAMSLIRRAQKIQAMGNPPLGTQAAYEKFAAERALMHDIQELVPDTKTDAVVKALNIPRTVKTMWDFSAPFRQGVVLAAGHPKEFAGAFGPMFKAAFDPAYAADLEARIATRPLAPVSKKAGLYLAEASESLTKREEAFMARLPGWTGAKASERAYTTFLNKLRSDVFDNVVQGWERVGYEYTEKDLKDWAQFVNWATGRGSLGSRLDRAAPVLSAAFFSPRFAVSRAEVAFAGGKALVSAVPGAGKVFGDQRLYSRAVANQVGKDLGTFMLGGMKVLGLLTWAQNSMGQDVEVNTDPRSTDFGKGRIGPVRVDIWGGEQQLARFMAQMVTGERLSSTGEVKKRSQDDTFWTFVRSKLSPQASLLNNMMRNENFQGRELVGPASSFVPKEFTPKAISESTLWQEMAPLVLQDALDAYHWGGAPAGALSLGLGAFGVGVNSYQTTRDLQDKVAQERFGADYTDLQRNKQREVDGSPEVTQSREDLKADQKYEADEAIKYGFKGHEEYTKKVAEQFMVDYPRLDNGEAKRKYIQNFKTSLRVSADAQVGAALEAAGRGERSSVNLADALAAQYWSTNPPLDTSTGGIDYKAWERERAPILKQAAQNGVTEEYIAGRGPNSYLDKKYRSLPDGVRKELEAYDAVQETLRPYWELKDQLKQKYPQFAQIEDMYNQYNADNSPMGEAKKRAVTGTETWKLYQKTMQTLQERARLKYPDIDNALVEWGYSPTPIKVQIAMRNR